uniref:BMERB domain-containing protein n=1 Tax=Cyprinodon variegatus TaxID=28743 RepID=A0A3Q2FRB1_CYPVA
MLNSTSPKVKSNHPWMTIVHPGPWSQLPPVPPPVPLPRSKTVSNPQTPWNRPRMSQTVQNLSSTRGPAPGHGFPLIRREVRTDQSVSMEDLRLQIRNLDGHLEALEKRGVDLERNIRECRMEEQMLIEWFILVHEQHILLRRNKDLVYLTKQQILEDRQADVEYELRCLLNKPEKDWSQEDKSREERLMAELVTIIEQRNQIISTLDQDRYTPENKDSSIYYYLFLTSQLRKSKGKLKASKSGKEPVERKS